MTAPTLTEPCYEQPKRAPLDDGGRIRVVQILATGSNGGAQEATWSLVRGMDQARYDVELVSLTDGPTVRRFERAGFRTTVIETDDDQEAVAQLLGHFRARQPHIVHNHMYRAEVVGTRAALALSEAGLPRPYIISTVHSSRIRSDEDRDLVRALTPHMDRLIAVSRAIVDKIETEGRAGAPVELIYNGVDLSRYDHQEACCTLPEEYGFETGTPLVGAVARLEPEKGPPDAARGLAIRPREGAGGAAADHRGGQPARSARGLCGGARPPRRAV